MEITNNPARVPLRASAEPVKADPPSISPCNELLSRAIDMLSAVGDRAAELLHALQDSLRDRCSTVALCGAALAANANRSAFDLDSLSTAIWQGHLPRQRTTT